MKVRQIVAVFFLLGLLASSGCSAEKPANPLKIGDQAPGFTVRDLDGGKISMADYAGTPVVLRFWSTECNYCRADTPIFNRYFERYKEQGLRVVYINRGSDEATVRDFVAELEIPFPVVMDRDGTLSASYKVKIEPQTIVIGPDQRILAAILGGVSEAELQQLLGRYLHPQRNGSADGPEGRAEKQEKNAL